MISILLNSSIFAETFNLNFLIQKTLNSHEDIKIQEKKLGLALAILDEEKSVRYPQLSLNASELYQDTLAHRPDYKLSLSQSLFSGIKSESIIKWQYYEVENQKILIQKTKRDLVSKLIPLYFSHLQIQKQLQNIEETMQLSSSRISELTRREKIGKSRKSEVLMAESQYASLKSRLQQLQGDLQQCKQSLYLLCRVPLSAYTVSERPPLKSTKSSFEKIDQRPELLILTSQKKSIESIFHITKHLFWPTISWNTNYYLNRTDALIPIKWDTGIVATLPFYQGGSEYAKMREINEMLQQNKIQIDKTKESIKVDILNDEIAFKTASNRRNSLGEAYQKAKESYRIYQEEYRLGLVNNLEVLQTLSLLLDTKLNLDQAIVEEQHMQTLLQFEQQEPLFDF